MPECCPWKPATQCSRDVSCATVFFDLSLRLYSKTHRGSRLRNGSFTGSAGESLALSPLRKEGEDQSSPPQGKRESRSDRGDKMLSLGFQLQPNKQRLSCRKHVKMPVRCLPTTQKRILGMLGPTVVRPLEVPWGILLASTEGSCAIVPPEARDLLTECSPRVRIEAEPESPSSWWQSGGQAGHSSQSTSPPLT